MSVSIISNMSRLLNDFEDFFNFQSVHLEGVGDSQPIPYNPGKATVLNLCLKWSKHDQL